MRTVCGGTTGLTFVGFVLDRHRMRHPAYDYLRLGLVADPLTTGGAPMTVPLSIGPVHHLRLTVTDVERSRAFYTEMLGFQTAMDAPPPADDPHYDLTLDLLQGGIVLVNGDLLLGLRPVDAERAGDRFDPFRCGLDHLSFAVAGRADLETAVQAFEDRGVEHSEITDLPPFGIAVLPFKDPDGVALELTAPL
jgi:catechol 2,3-dioxygenase-like lactoylglutathione lyase family enzyme